MRLRQHEANARQVTAYLASHPAVATVHYPGLADHPQHALARRQMGGFGGMVSFIVKGGREEANTFVSNLRVFSLAESLGGVESLACYPPEMTHGSIPAAERQRRGITAGMISLSVGIEDVKDLIADLEQALAHVPTSHRGNAAH